MFAAVQSVRLQVRMALITAHSPSFQLGTFNADFNAGIGDYSNALIRVLPTVEPHLVCLIVRVPRERFSYTTGIILLVNFLVLHGTIQKLLSYYS